MTSPPEAQAQLLPKLADVRLDNLLRNVIVKNTVDGIENLGLGDPPVSVLGEVFQYPPLAARQGQRRAIQLRIATVEIDLEIAGARMAHQLAPPPLHRVGPHDQLFDVNRLAHDIVDTGREQVDDLTERSFFRQGDDRSRRPAPYPRRKRSALRNVSEHEPPDRSQVFLRSGFQPFPELSTIESLCRESFNCEGRNVVLGHWRTLIDDNIHQQAPSSCC